MSDWIMPRNLFWTLVFFFLPNALSAHPVPKDNYDRKIVLHVRKGESAAEAKFLVNFRLEVDALTLFARDMEPFRDEVDIFTYRGREVEYYRQFARIYGPILAGLLDLKVDGRESPLRCTHFDAALRDEMGEPLGHVRCDFRFEGVTTVRAAEATSLTFVDRTYPFLEGDINVRLQNDGGLIIERLVEASEEVRKRTKLQRRLEDDDILRSLSATITVPRESSAAPTPVASVEPGPKADDGSARTKTGNRFRLSQLFFTGYQGFWLTMLFSFLFGGAHALTPGHGKTLVAAYLIGERGTAWHAAMLGVVTTLTHTGMVLLLATALFFMPREWQGGFQSAMQNGLTLAMGLSVVGLGFWLLLQRLAGRADHFHVGGGHHHHHHQGPMLQPQSTPVETTAAEATPAEPAPATTAPATAAPATSVSWFSLLVLGVTGGLVPCWDAVVLLLHMMGHRQFLLALPAVTFFSLGLASVLVAIGILVVYAPRALGVKTAGGTWSKALPFISAIFIIAMGIWLCFEGSHPDFSSE